MGLTTRQTHRVRDREREAGGWMESHCASQPVSQPFIHSDGQSASQPISPSFHGEVCVTAADKRCTIFMLFCGKTKKCSFSPSLPLYAQAVHTLTKNVSVNVMNRTEKQKLRSRSSLDLKACCNTPCSFKITIMGNLIRSHFTDLSNKCPVKSVL